MISKIAENVTAAVGDIRDGSTVMIGGFGSAGQPVELIDALLDQGARDLVVVNNNAGNGTTGLAALLHPFGRSRDQPSAVVASIRRRRPGSVSSRSRNPRRRSARQR